MPTVLGTSFSKTWEGIPPHMSTEDLIIWKDYKSQAIKNSINIYFDVGIGGETRVPPGTTPEMALMWLRNTQKRIDVLIEEETRWIIIELRARAQASAVGRLLQYFDLFKDDPPNNKPIFLRLITNNEDRDTKRLAEKMGIDFVVV